ncbi:MAG: HAMP domain-containing histidine kinase [Oscillospiraceae bacterium]|nr:HAMP domain-containing histidine kinase [Oscillospiraceae bacterium]
MQLKMALSYIVIIFGMLVLLNVYPVYVSQNFILRSKQDTMQDRVSLLSSLLSGIETLSAESVSRVMDIIDESGNTRCIVTDDNLRAIYDNSVTENCTGKIILLQEIRYAINRNDVFFAEYTEEAIICKASAPILLDGRVLGTVYLYEADEAQAALLRDIQVNLMNISFLVSIVVVTLSFSLSKFLTRRIGNLLRAVKTFGDGDYSHRSYIKGRDELSLLSQEFNRFSERFEKAEEMRRRFVSDASHELKTPLASVKLLADSIVQNDDMPPEMMREFALDIGDEVNRLTRLTEKLLDMTRLDADIPQSVYPVDLTETVRRVAHMVDPLTKERNITIEMQLENDCVIKATDDAAYQIIFNIVENAIKYSKQDGFVRIFLFLKEERVNLIVDDTGIGIPEEDIERIFDRFYRVDKARSREAGGSGLGLSIVWSAVKQHKGEIDIKSKLGEGTRVNIVFPIFSGEDGEI